MTLRSVAVSHTAAALLLAGAVAFSTATPGQAHKAITSKYTFNEDMYPLFRQHCGACHVDGGVAPMSLLTHDDAAPWAESLRLEFLSEDGAPPWHTFKLSAREFDMVLVWANGGTPRGDVANAPKPATVVNDWAGGTPEVRLAMPSAFTLAPAVNEASHEVTLPLTSFAGREFVAVDVLPGNPAIVRSAELLVRTSDGTTRSLGAWMPGRTSSIALATPLKVQAGAVLVARLEYKRTWKYEGQSLSDTSTFGLHAAPARARR